MIVNAHGLEPPLCLQGPEGVDDVPEAIKRARPEIGVYVFIHHRGIDLELVAHWPCIGPDSRQLGLVGEGMGVTTVDVGQAGLPYLLKSLPARPGVPGPEKNGNLPVSRKQIAVDVFH